MLYHVCVVVTTLGGFTWIENDIATLESKKQALRDSVKPDQILSETQGTVEAPNLSMAIHIVSSDWRQMWKGQEGKP